MNTSNRCLFRQIFLVTATTLLAACSILKPAEQPAATGPAPASAQKEASASWFPEIPDLPSIFSKKGDITVKTNCSLKDPDGYSAGTNIDVDDSKVTRFSARLSLPKNRGQCQYPDTGWHQTKVSPHIELHYNNGCIIRMWRQDKQVTVAFESCERFCDKNTFDKTWPILINSANGKCT